MFCVVSYDIEDDNRRNKAAKILLDFGRRVQYSVYECLVDDKDLKKLVNRLQKTISEQTDSVRIYVLCANCKKTVKIMGLGQLTEEKEIYIV
jgi:CRISPR-associated protein Cas2